MSDLNRNVICLFGMPVDDVTMQDTVLRVRDAVRTGRRLFLSTPNLSFLIGCQQDLVFRASVIDSDLSVADGMPLVWMARLLGVPLPERVTGSGLFERLRDDPLPGADSPIRVYFFGGPPGAAQAAGRSLNERSGAMVCVGHESPGFGSVEDMSGQDVIERINASGADFLVVALGAVKGQAWIQRNRARLNAAVISHLGAVVNFAAGTVSRAPVWVQRSGLEWLWRIKEEPALWRRYAKDARAFARLFFTSLLPHMLWLRTHGTASAAVQVELSRDERGTRLAVRGCLRGPVPEQVRGAMIECERLDGPVWLDLAGADGFGPEFAGLLLLLDKVLAARNRRLGLIGVSAATRRVLVWNGLGGLLERA